MQVFSSEALPATIVLFFEKYLSVSLCFPMLIYYSPMSFLKRP